MNEYKFHNINSPMIFDIKANNEDQAWEYFNDLMKHFPLSDGPWRILCEIRTIEKIEV